MSRSSHKVMPGCTTQVALGIEHTMAGGRWSSKRNVRAACETAVGLSRISEIWRRRRRASPAIFIRETRGCPFIRTEGRGHNQCLKRRLRFGIRGEDAQHSRARGHCCVQDVVWCGNRNGAVVRRGGRAKAASPYRAWRRRNHQDSCRSMRRNGELSHPAPWWHDEYASASVVWRRVVGRGAQKHTRCSILKGSFRRSRRGQAVLCRRNCWSAFALDRSTRVDTRRRYC